MSNILLVRHGESKWNVENRIQGWAASELTERGEKETRRTAEYINENWEVSQIITSDLVRAVQTAKIIQNSISPKVPISEESLWREQDFGPYQGFTDEEYADILSSDNNMESSKPVQRGETPYDVRKRTMDAIEKIDTDVQGVPVIVTHSGPIVQIIGNVYGYDPIESYDNISISNNQIIHCDITDGIQIVSGYSAVDRFDDEILSRN